MSKPIVPHDNNLRETMRIIDETAKRTAILVDDNDIIVGVITDGDIRRAILNGASLTQPAIDFAAKNFHYVKEGTPQELIRQKMKDLKIVQLPEITEDGKLVKLHTLTDESSGFEEKAIKKILVIGGAGYVGHHVIDLLLKENYEVRCLDIGLYPESEGIPHAIHNPAVEYIKGDMRDIKTLVEILKDVDAVVLLAAIVGDPASKDNPEAAITINYLSASLIAMTCRYLQINRFVFISTCSVYGQGDDYLTETSSLQPVSLYGQNKVEAEKAILRIADSNFRPTILRFGTIFGTSGRMRFDLVINILAAKAVNDGKITIFGGDQWRPLVHVRDASSAIPLIFSKPLSEVGNQIYNVGCNNQNYKIKDLAGFFENEFDNLEVDILTEDTDQRDYKVNFDKISNLGFKCDISIPDSIKEIREFIKEYNIDYTQSIFSNVKFLKTIQSEL